MNKANKKWILQSKINSINQSKIRTIIKRKKISKTRRTSVQSRIEVRKISSPLHKPFQNFLNERKKNKSFLKSQLRSKSISQTSPIRFDSVSSYRTLDSKFNRRATSITPQSLKNSRPLNTSSSVASQNKLQKFIIKRNPTPEIFDSMVTRK